MTIQRNLRGWRRDLPDHRDFLLRTLPGAQPYPQSVDLRGDNFPPVFDQGQLGSCVENAWGAACSYAEAKEGNGVIVLSRLAHYWDVRRMNGEIDQDNGSTIRDGIKSIKATGLCLESEWPYDVRKWRDQPPLSALHSGYHRHKSLSYWRITSRSDMFHCLADGFPFVFGMVLFPQYEEVGPDGVVKMPGQNEAPIGGHAQCAVGYDLSRSMFLIRNSWGDGWGLKGHCWVPFDYIQAFASDFWTIRKIAA